MRTVDSMTLALCIFLKLAHALIYLAVHTEYANWEEKHEFI